MANQLKMAKILMVRELHRNGWSQRRIARELELDRETVRKYLKLAHQPSQRTNGSGATTPEPDSKPAIPPAGSEQSDSTEDRAPLAVGRADLAIRGSASRHDEEPVAAAPCW